MFGKVLALLAVPLGLVAYSSLAKASPKGGATFFVKGTLGDWRVTRVSQFQQPDGLLVINDVFATGSHAGDRVMRYSQLGSSKATRKYITSPFEATGGAGLSPGADRVLLKAASDFGVTLPPALRAKLPASI